MVPTFGHEATEYLYSVLNMFFYESTMRAHVEVLMDEYTHTSRFLESLHDKVSGSHCVLGGFCGQRAGMKYPPASPPEMTQESSWLGA